MLTICRPTMREVSIDKQLHDEERRVPTRTLGSIKMLANAKAPALSIRLESKHKIEYPMDRIRQTHFRSIMTAKAFIPSIKP